MTGRPKRTSHSTLPAPLHTGQIVLVPVLLLAVVGTGFKGDGCFRVLICYSN